MSTAISASRSAFADWGPTLTCYTGPLAVYRSVEDERWWLPLVEGGPHLGLSPAPGGLLTFRHHPRPPAQVIGLTARAADDWDTAWECLRDELDTHGRVVVAADAWNLPWLTSAGRRHGPHWFVLARAGSGFVVDDPLDLVDDCGRQQPVHVRLTEDDLPACCGALTDPAPEHTLREEAALGASPTGLGRSYRWLVRGEPVLAWPEPATASGIHQLADWFAVAAADPGAYAQVDDVWQAQRQRELMVRVLNVESGLRPLRDLPAPEPWRRVAELWRRIPPLLMHARLLARQGTRGRSAEALVENLRMIAEAESRLTDQRFPQVVL